MKSFENMMAQVENGKTREFLKEYKILCEKYDRILVAVAQHQVAILPKKDNVNNLAPVVNNSDNK